MLIGIDGNEANVEQRVGIGEYAYELLSKFEEFRISNFEFRIYLKEQPLSHMPKRRQGWEYVIFGPKPLWTQVALPLKLFREKERPDVFFSPSHYGPRFSPVKNAISIMDLSFLKFPYLFNTKDLNQLRAWTAYSARKSSLIFTISQSSRNDIIEEYKLPGKKVVVTYLGIKQEMSRKQVKNIREKYSIDSDFVLFVGTIQPRKNIKRLIEAFSKIKQKNVSLIIVGKKGWQYEEIFKAPKEYNVFDRVKFLDFVSDEDLLALYGEALCFVLPSLYEGFGLPILEAMKNGAPVITSNVSSMPEAGGDAALYVDPQDVSDIAKKIEEVVGSEKLREELRAKGKEQIKKFSWDKTATQTLTALEGLYGK